MWLAWLNLASSTAGYKHIWISVLCIDTERSSGVHFFLLRPFVVVQSFIRFLYQWVLVLCVGLCENAHFRGIDLKIDGFFKTWKSFDLRSTTGNDHSIMFDTIQIYRLSFGPVTCAKLFLKNSNATRTHMHTQHKEKKVERIEEEEEKKLLLIMLL